MNTKVRHFKRSINRLQRNKKLNKTLRQNSKYMAVAAGVGAALLARELIARLREANLAGQVVLITGGTRGLGYLLAKEFAQQGCRLALCARDGEEIDRARTELRAMGAEVIALLCDVGDKAQVDYMIDAIMEHYGQIDILVNNAGVISVGPIELQTAKDFADQMNVMFWSNVYCTLAILPQMLQRHSGRIVNITSIGGKVSVPHLLPYCAAKFAAVGFSEGLRAELGGKGITVTTIAPGLMRTGSYLNAMFKGQLDKEFELFSLLNNLPVTSMDAQRAARQIIRAVKRGDAEHVLSGTATMLDWMHRLFPAQTMRILAFVNQYMLPAAEQGTHKSVRGMEIDEEIENPVLETLLTLGRAAAEQNLEFPGPIEVLAEEDQIAEEINIHIDLGGLDV